MAIACLASAAQPAPAQSPPDAGQILQQQQRIVPALPQRLPAPEKATPSPLPAPAGDSKVAVQRVRFSGGERLLSEEQLQAQAAGMIGQTVGFAQLQQLAERITQALKARGWLLARAYLPPQDLTEGTVHIAIQRGRIQGDRQGSGFEIQGENLRLDKERIRATVARALFVDDADGLHSLRLERGLLLLNDLPGIGARSTLEKGTEADTTQLGLRLSEGELLGGSLQLDNQGSRYTGSDRITAQAYANDPSGRGDQLSFVAAVAAGLQMATVGYALPLGYSGLGANMGLTNLKYHLGKELAANQSRGTADTVNMGLSYPLLRSRQMNLRSQLSAEHKALRDETLGSVIKDRRVDSVGLGLNGDRLDQFAGGGMLNAWLTGTKGQADYSRVQADVAADATAQTAGQFAKLQFGLARLQRLTDQLSLYGSLTGQRANHNLPSSEKFILGGSSAVRAYPSGEGSGDAGELLSIELRYDVSGMTDQRQLQVAGFVDAGRILLNKSPWAGSVGNATASNNYTLAGTGIGVSYTHGPRFSMRAVWAAKIGSNPGRSLAGNDSDAKNDRNRFWLTATIRL